MELKVNREVITVCEELYSGVQEQSTELDYILPDYFPEIFRIIQARMEPRIESYAISDGVLTYELCVEICVLYCAQDSPAVHCVRQKLCYTRTVELGRQCEGIAAELIPKPDYVNCRAVNQRRIDLRGVVSVRIRATCGSQQEVIGDIFGLHAQTRKEPVTYTARRLHGVRTFTLSEVAELGEAKPAALQILRTDVQLLGGDAGSSPESWRQRGTQWCGCCTAARGAWNPCSLPCPTARSWIWRHRRRLFLHCPAGACRL